jgi:hypothetical protein
MADYVQTPGNVLASIFALRLQPIPAFTVRGAPPSSIPNVLIAGAAITAGQPVYQGIDNLFYPTDANGADPLFKVVGMAENNAGIGQPISVVYYDPQFTPGCALLVGDIPIVSATAGKICPSSDMASGMFVSPLGVAFSVTQMSLNITRADVARA